MPETRNNTIMPSGREQPILLTRDELSDLYITEGLSTYKIAERMGVKQGVVKRWLKVYEIETRKKSAPAEAKLLQSLYEGDGLNFSEIGRKFNQDRHTVRRWIANAGIPLRQPVQVPNSIELERLYLTERMTTYEIATKFGVSPTTAGEWLRDASIQRRPGNNGLLNRGITPPTREELTLMVHTDHMSYDQIAACYSVDLTAVAYWLRRHDIPRPTAWDTRYKGKAPTLPSKEQVAEAYEDGASLAQVAEMYEVSEMIIRRLCRDYEIVVRPNGWNGGKRHLCSDGHLVKSIYERRVDNWLTEHGVAHEYEPRLPFSQFLKSDFLANGWYIEVWGVRNKPSYESRKARKIEGYRAFNLPLIQIPAHAFNADQNRLWHRLLSRNLRPSDQSDPSA